MQIRTRYNTISFKVASIVGMATFILVGMLITYSIVQLKSNAVNSARENALFMARDYAAILKATVEGPLAASRSFSSALLAVKDEETATSFTREEVNAMLKNYLNSNTSIMGTYTLWEPNAFDGKDSMYINTPGHDKTGRFIPYWVRVNDKITLEPLLNYETSGSGDYYLLPKQTARETVTNPFLYPVGGKEVLTMSVVVPIVKNGKFHGITGSDISIDWIQSMIDADQEHIFGGRGQLYIIAGNGTLAAASGKKEWLGKQARQVITHMHHLENRNNYISNDTLSVYAPLTFGQAGGTWQVWIDVPLQELTREAEAQMMSLVWLSLAFLAVFVVFIVVLLRKQIDPVLRISAIAEQVAQGNLAIEQVEASNLEIKKLNDAFLKVVASQQDITTVCTSIAQGDFSKKAEVKSDKDSLAKAVNQMIDTLQHTAQEDEKRKWVSDGLATFGEILRSDKELRLLAESILANLIKYTNSNQGGFFVVNEAEAADIHLELIACYAFNRKKFIQKRIEIGQGLAGQCYLEKDTIYLTEIPDNYVYITSGLGEANPRSLLIVPLLNNGKVEGVLELASFKTFNEHEITFIQNIAESVASTISTVKINQRTKELLEKSQQQAEALLTQEEEMRQNMEELTATQEEMTRKQVELGGQIAALNNAAIVSEVDLRGNILFVNDAFCRIAKYTREELIGKKQSIVRHPDMPSAIFDDLWATIIKGNVWKGEIKNQAKDGTHYWVDATITPVVGENGRPIKYIGVRYDITQKKEQESRIEQAINEAQEKSAQIQVQKEELHQNIEELQATQEEMRRIHEHLQLKDKEREQTVEELTQIRNALEDKLTQKLQETECQKARIEVFLKTASDAILFMDAMGNITSFNGATENLFGYKGEELSGKSLSLILQFTAADNPIQHILASLQAKKTSWAEYTGKSKLYGYQFPVEVCLKEGKVNDEIIYVAMIRDISKRKKAEAEVQKNLNMFQGLQQKMRDSQQKVNVLSEQLKEKEDLLILKEEEIKTLKN